MIVSPLRSEGNGTWRIAEIDIVVAVGFGNRHTATTGMIVSLPVPA